MSHTYSARSVRGHAFVIAAAVLLFTLAGVGLGFWAGRYSGNPDGANIRLDRLQPGGVLDLDAFEPSASERIDAIVSRLGEMQAQLMRINALGERLTEMSGLSPQEFDFQNPPPQGGPDDGVGEDYTQAELSDELNRVVLMVRDRQRKLELIEDFIMEKDLRAEALPAGWPVRAGYISSSYGLRIHPVKKTRLFHDGVDLASPRGSPIVAVADGVVVFSGRKGGYGNVVDIRHIDGLVTRYAHNARNAVKEGQLVRQGQTIATVGATGTATGPHVHFEVRKGGKPVDPMPYLRLRPRQTLASNTLSQEG